MELDDIITLAQAGKELKIAPVSLRSAIARGTFDARKVGTTWITTRQEVERYRQERLGRVGRPPSAAATHIRPPKGSALGMVPKASATHIGPPKAP